MSGRGKGGKAKVVESRSRSSRAGLQFPVGGKKVEVKIKSIYSEMARKEKELKEENKKLRKKLEGVKAQLNKLLSGVTIAQGGVLPNIQAVLLPKKSQCAGGKSDKE
jgi:histone H2A